MATVYRRADSELEEVALTGPRLAQAMLAADLPGHYDYAARTKDFPTGGLHVDEALQRVEVWLAPPAPAFERRLRSAWPGWDVRWHGDRFEHVTSQLASRLLLPVTTPDDLVTQVRTAVLRESRDQSGLVRDIRARLAAESGSAEDVHVNPRALRDDPAPSPGPGRAGDFDRAVERWRGRSV